MTTDEKKAEKLKEILKRLEVIEDHLAEVLFHLKLRNGAGIELWKEFEKQIKKIRKD